MIAMPGMFTMISRPAAAVHWLASAVVPHAEPTAWSVVAAWLGAILVGLSLGLLGSGGGILTTPLLTLLVGHADKAAVVESLAIVGAIAAVGTLRAARAGRLDWWSAFLLILPGMLGAWIGTQAARQVAGSVQMVALAALLVAAATAMLRRPPAGASTAAPETPGTIDDASPRPPTPASGAQGFALGLGLGFLTSFVGVGGGFLIVPVLTTFRRLPMRIATGTSLCVITANCAVGLASSLGPGLAGQGSAAPPPTVDWGTVGVFSALGIAGSLVGSALAGRLPERTLRRGFALFLILVAAILAANRLPGLGR